MIQDFLNKKLTFSLMVDFCVAHLERGKDDKSVAILVSIISGDTIGCIL